MDPTQVLRRIKRDAAADAAAQAEFNEKRSVDPSDIDLLALTIVLLSRCHPRYVPGCCNHFSFALFTNVTGGYGYPTHPRAFCQVGSSRNLAKREVKMQSQRWWLPVQGRSGRWRNISYLR